MTHLTTASKQLFSRPPDERFASLDALHGYCRSERERAREHWLPPGEIVPEVDCGQVRLALNGDGSFHLNHWSFSQLCSLCHINRDTVNRLSSETARQALRETLPQGSKPLQLLSTDGTVRALHGITYSRLWNEDLITAIRECAPGFEPPPRGAGGATGLYAGEEDCFLFLIDPAGWCEIGGEAFAPGLFAWNSEVGRRSIGVQTFWFQAVCQNHIVWDATEVVDFTRKHTGKIEESLTEVRRIIEALASKRDERRDGFATVVAKAMGECVADTAEGAAKFLAKHGITRGRIKTVVQQIGQEGKPFTLWSLVDALTRLNGDLRYAGDRTEADQKASALLRLAV